MTHDLQAPYWGLGHGGVDNVTPADASHIGLPYDNAATNGASAENTMVHEALHRHGYFGPCHSARQVFAQLKGDMFNTIMPMPWPCSRVAPAAVNVYTDGSWQFPLRHNFALGGAGVWWPKRNLSTHKTSEAERELAHIVSEADGVRLCTRHSMS